MLFEKHIKFTANGMCSRNKTATKNASGHVIVHLTSPRRGALHSVTHLARGDSVIINLAAVMCTFIFLSMRFRDSPQYILSPLRVKLLPAVGAIDLDGPQLMNVSFHNMCHLCIKATISLFFFLFPL